LKNGYICYGVSKFKNRLITADIKKEYHGLNRVSAVTQIYNQRHTILGHKELDVLDFRGKFPTMHYRAEGAAEPTMENCVSKPMSTGEAKHLGGVMREHQKLLMPWQGPLKDQKYLNNTEQTLGGFSKYKVPIGENEKSDAAQEANYKAETLELSIRSIDNVYRDALKMAEDNPSVDKDVIIATVSQNVLLLLKTEIIGPNEESTIENKSEEKRWVSQLYFDKSSSPDNIED
jgi:hypothetical protein